MFTPLRLALRMLRKNPAFTLVAIGSLAIGIGATSGSFSIADAMLTRPLPVPEPGNVVAITPAKMGAFGANSWLSYPDYRDFRDNNRTFDGLVASSFSAFGFSPDASTLPKTIYGAYVSGNFFRVLGVQPVLGRAILESEDQAVGRDAVVVLGHDFWVSELNANPAVLGTSIRLNGVEFRIVGVTSGQFTGVEPMVKSALFVPLAMYTRLGGGNILEKRDARWLTVKGRLKPGVSVAQANADLGSIAARLEQLYPQTNRNRQIQVQTQLQFRVKQVPPQAALAAMLAILAICVLLVACANVAGLLLSRARARSREMAVRLAIGASRGALIRQLFLENLLLALAGGLAGILLANNITDFFNTIPIPSDVPVSLKAVIDPRALLFTLAVSILSTFVFGLAPAIRATRVDVVPSLKALDADSSGRKRLWGRNVIVAGQVALSLLLLVVSALSWQGFRDVLKQGTGFRTDHLYLAGFNTRPLNYSEEQNRRFYKDLLDKTRLAPGVQSAALASDIPLGFNEDSVGVVPQGYTLPPGQQALNILNYYVSDGYFQTQGVRLLRGRGFQNTDQAGAPLVAVVNTQFAQHYWPHQDALGKRFHLRDATGPLVEIVGIAETGKYVWVTEPRLDFIYLPYTQHLTRALTILVESSAPDAAVLAPVLRQVVRKIDPAMPYSNARTMQDFFSQRAVKTTNLIVETVSSLGLMGLLLAMVGLYALVAYSVSRRSREIGIRMAIGADRQGVLRMVLRQGLVLGSIGVVVGLILSFFACRALTANLWTGSGSINYLVLPAVALPLLLVTLLAAYVPARRASLIDPMRALRDE
ncbi:MAG: ABC transporter permease [Bryobacteraceae bacterium]